MAGFKTRVNQVHAELMGLETVMFALDFEKDKMIEDNVENENLHLIVFNVKGGEDG